MRDADLGAAEQLAGRRERDLGGADAAHLARGDPLDDRIRWQPRAQKRQSRVRGDIGRAAAAGMIGVGNAW